MPVNVSNGVTAKMTMQANVFKSNTTIKAILIALVVFCVFMFPSGVFADGWFVVAWSGELSAIPDNYQLCDGTNGAPDLRDRFLVGAGGDYAVADMGGTITHTHSHHVTSHEHAIPQDWGHVHPVVTQLVDQDPSPTNPLAVVVAVQAAGQHNHAAVTGSTSPTTSEQLLDNRPPYYAVCYLCTRDLGAAISASDPYTFTVSGETISIERAYTYGDIVVGTMLVVLLTACAVAALGWAIVGQRRAS